MKKILILLFCIFLVTGCQKNPFDYRTKFVGDYNFTVRLTTWTIYEQTGDTTYLFKGKIWYDGNEKMVSVEFSGYQPEKVNLYEDGSMKGQHVNGEFVSTKKVRFKVTYNALGGGAQYSIIGDKAK